MDISSLKGLSKESVERLRSDLICAIELDDSIIKDIINRTSSLILSDDSGSVLSAAEEIERLHGVSEDKAERAFRFVGLVVGVCYKDNVDQSGLEKLCNVIDSVVSKDGDVEKRDIKELLDKIYRVYSGETLSKISIVESVRRTHPCLSSYDYVLDARAVISSADMEADLEGPVIAGYAPVISMRLQLDSGGCDDVSFQMDIKTIDAFIKKLQQARVGAKSIEDAIEVFSKAGKEG